MVSPPPDLIAATHAGGLTAGAFEGERMLGFVHGIPRTNAGVPCQHSHLLAVAPEAQGRGLAVRLKLFQRSWCLARGIALCTWTYDPFLLKNARLNLVRLGGTVSRFLPNFYGRMGGIYGSLPSDRFEVEWRLDDPRVERAALEEKTDTLIPEPGSIPVATTVEIPDAPRVALQVPAGGVAAFVGDLEAGRRARREFAQVASALFERGYRATAAFGPEGRTPFYLMQRP